MSARRLRHQVPHEFKVHGIAEVRDLRPFRLEEFQAPTCIHHKIHFAGAVSPKEETACAPPAAFASAKLGENKGLPYRSRSRRVQQRVRGSDIQQRAKQARVGKEEFWTLDDGLGSIGEPRLQQHNLAGGFKHGQPLICCRWRDANIACQIGLVQKVPGAEGAGAQESLKVAQIADIGKSAHIAFKIGRKIGVVEGNRVDLRVCIKLRKTTPHDGCCEFG